MLVGTLIRQKTTKHVGGRDDGLVRRLIDVNVSKIEYVDDVIQVSILPLLKVIKPFRAEESI